MFKCMIFCDVTFLPVVNFGSFLLYFSKQSKDVRLVIMQLQSMLLKSRCTFTQLKYAVTVILAAVIMSSH